jgi:hypothetical protein
VVTAPADAFRIPLSESIVIPGVVIVPSAAIVVVAVPPKYARVAESWVVDALPTNCCSDVNVFACERLSDATTAPVVGEMVRVPSEFETALTVPAPEPQAEPVIESLPVESACTQLVPVEPKFETTRSVVDAVPLTVNTVVDALPNVVRPSAVSACVVTLPSDVIVVVADPPTASVFAENAVVDAPPEKVSSVVVAFEGKRYPNELPPAPHAEPVFVTFPLTSICKQLLPVAAACPLRTKLEDVAVPFTVRPPVTVPLPTVVDAVERRPPLNERRVDVALLGNSYPIALVMVIPPVDAES